MRWNRLSLAAAAAVLLLAAAADAETIRLQIVVAAGEFERNNTPVRTLVTLPAGFDSSCAVTLTSGNGEKIAGQLAAPRLLAKQEPGEGAQELHFVLPHLAAGEEMKWTAVIDSGGNPSSPAYHWESMRERYTELQFGDRPVLRYMHSPLDEGSPELREETYKIYHHVFDPQGTRLVTKGPGGLYTHHRGLFYGFNRISYGDGKTADIWHCKSGESQTHQEFVNAETGPVLGRHLLRINWNGKDGEVFAEELRELSAYHVGGGLLIEFASRLESRAGMVKLDGDPQHAGFHFRAAQDVAESTKSETYYLRPDGRDKPGSYRNWPQSKEHVNLIWNALSFVLGEQRYTCCYLDRPENPKEARFSERDYGRFGSYFEYILTEESPLAVNYRIWLQEGEMTVEEVASRSSDFISPPKVTAAEAK